MRLGVTGTNSSLWSARTIPGAAKRLISRALAGFGYSVERLDAPRVLPHTPASEINVYLQAHEVYGPVIERVKPYSMTSPARIAALCDATRHIVRRHIPGGIVECGVWRGGSIMAVAITLLQESDVRDLYLFDTFAGMTEPTKYDADWDGNSAEQFYNAWKNGTYDPNWCVASLEDVKRNVLSTGYPEDRIHFIKGDVLQTIPHHDIGDIAILRLDTDWYESTRHELKWLYPKVRPGGFLIIDDFGYWQGCRRAVEEYFGNRGPFLSIIDQTGRLAIKFGTDDLAAGQRGSARVAE